MMLKVDKFLCCYSLETGGIFYGWLGMFCCGLVITIASFLIAAFSIVSCVDLKHIVESMEPNQVAEDFEEFCVNRKVIIITLLVIYIALHAFGILISWNTVKGTKARNPRSLIPFLIVIAIYFAISLTCFYNVDPFSIGFGLATVIFDAYAFICIYSLYAKFKDEERINNREGVNTKMNQPEAKV